MWNIKWTKKEIAVIKRLYPKNGIIDVIKLIDRTDRAIQSRARRLKLIVKPSFNIHHMDIPKILKAYLAGHFDGEGCIRFQKNGKCFSPRISIHICNLKTLKLYKKYFNGNIRLKRQLDKNKPIFTWQCDRFNDVYNFCLATFPFSIEKKEQLRLAIEHLKEWKVMGNIRNPTDEFRNHSLERANKCKDLKHL